MSEENQNTILPGGHARFASVIAFLTAGVTLITFAMAATTLPLSGPFCQEGCFAYPYAEAVTRFPRDYGWMLPAMGATALYLALFACIHEFAAPEKRLYSRIALFFAGMASLTLIGDYFVQVSVIQPSLLAGETDGIALLSQFNPHGLFIALEELGYLLMSVSFLAAAPAIPGTSGTARAARTVFLAAFGLAWAALIAVLLQHGVHREYLFEVYVIIIDWLALIANGVLLGITFQRAGHE